MQVTLWKCLPIWIYMPQKVCMYLIQHQLFYFKQKSWSSTRHTCLCDLVPSVFTEGVHVFWVHFLNELLCMHTYKHAGTHIRNLPVCFCPFATCKKLWGRKLRKLKNYKRATCYNTALDWGCNSPVTEWTFYVFIFLKYAIRFTYKYLMIGTLK